MRSLRIQFVLLLSWALVSLPLHAAPAAIVSRLMGVVSLNGHRVVNGEAVRAGDRVRVSPKGGARLVLPDSVVLAAAGARFRYLSHANSIRLAYGALRVSGRMRVLASAYAVSPLAGNGIYTVLRHNSDVFIKVNRGRVEVRGLHKSYTLAAGKSLNLGFPAAAAQANTTGAGAAGTGSYDAWIVGALAALGVVAGVVVHQAMTTSSSQ